MACACDRLERRYNSGWLQTRRLPTAHSGKVAAIGSGLKVSERASERAFSLDAPSMPAVDPWVPVAIQGSNGVSHRGVIGSGLQKLDVLNAMDKKKDRWLPHPFSTGCSPLNCSGNPGVNVAYREGGLYL